MANDIQNKKVKPLPYDENAKPLSGIVFPLVDGTGNITGWVPVATVDQGDGTHALKTITDVSFNDPDLDIGDVHLLNTSDTKINPATLENQQSIITTLTDILNQLDVDLSTVATEATLDLVRVAAESIDTSMDVSLSTRASEATLSSIDTTLDTDLSTRASEATLSSIDLSVDVDLSTRASEATLGLIESAIDVNLSTRASEATLALIEAAVDVDLSTRASESTLSTLLTESDFDSKIGEVQDTPTQYTLLARLKDIATQVTTQVSTWVHDGIGNAITSTSESITSKVGLDVKVIDRTDPRQYYSRQGRMFATSIEGNLPTNGTEIPLLLFSNPGGSGVQLEIARVTTDIITKGNQATFRIYVNPTVTANGTALTVARLNIGGSGPANVATAFSFPTVSANGTKALVYSVGKDQSSYTFEADLATILQPGITLLVTGTPSANNVSVAMTPSWVQI